MRLLSGSVLVGISLLCTSNLRAADDPRQDLLEKTFPAKAGGHLVIATDRGNLTVEGADLSEVRFQVRRKVVRGTEAEATELLRQHEVKFSQDGDTVRLEARVPGRQGGSWKRPQLEVQIVAQVPREFHVEAQTAGGSVRGTDLKGDIQLKTSGGSVRLEKLQGIIQGQTAGGSIQGKDLAGKVDVSTSGGSIQLEEVRGEGLKARTSGGSIQLTKIDAPVNAQTSGGSIELETSATPVSASTAGGSVRAVLHQAPKADVVLKTSAGGVQLTLPKNAAFELDAATSAGSVQSDFEVGPRGKDRSELKGSANGGGPLVKLRTSAGGIRVKAE